MSVFLFLMPTSSQVSKCQVYVAGLGQDPWKNQPTPHIFFSKIKAEFEWSPSKYGKAPNYIYLFLYVIIFNKTYLSTLDPRKNMIFDQRYCRQLFTKFIKNHNAMEEVSFSTVGIRCSYSVMQQCSSTNKSKLRFHISRQNLAVMPKSIRFFFKIKS